MSFATSNVVRDNMGTINALRGNWTGSVGDDVGTITGSGYATSAEFDANLSTTPGEDVVTRISNSSGTWTVTILNHQNVTNGSFVIRFK
jgi:hypothetical protein